MINVGIIGLGVGEAHAKAFDAVENCSVAALCDLDQKRLNSIGKSFPNAKLVTDANYILNDPSIDAVCIASFDNFHKEQVVKALDNGKHVFVEKPLCLTREEALEIREALDRNLNLKLTSNLILRRCPRFVELKSMIDKKELGALSYIEGDYNYGRIHKLTEGWRGQIPFYSVVLGGGLHLIDLILWLTDDTPQSVTAIGNNLSSKKTQFKFNDLVASLIQFDSGLVAKVTSNFGCVMPHFHSLQIYGDKATFINGRKEATLYTSREPEDEPRKITSAYPAVEKGELIPNFIAAILSREELAVETDEVFSALSVGLAIEKSMQEGRTVDIEQI